MKADGAQVEERRWARAEAIPVARELVERLQPLCERLILAGSLRRRKQDVGDIEILYVGRRELRKVDLLADGMVDVADEEIERMVREGVLVKRPSVSGSTAWGQRNKFAIHKASGIPVDLFATTADAWFNYLVCRTGPAASNMRICDAARARGYRWNPYGPGFTRMSDGEVVAMGSEQAVFTFVGLTYAEPWERR
jgi:DNA polymerase/3'-5' exonuclease PolX